MRRPAPQIDMSEGLGGPSLPPPSLPHLQIAKFEDERGGGGTGPRRGAAEGQVRTISPWLERSMAAVYTFEFAILAKNCLGFRV